MATFVSQSVTVVLTSFISMPCLSIRSAVSTHKMSKLMVQWLVNLKNRQLLYKTYGFKLVRIWNGTSIFLIKCGSGGQGAYYCSSTAA